MVARGDRLEWRLVLIACVLFGFVSGGHLLIGGLFIFREPPPLVVILVVTLAPPIFWGALTPLIFHFAKRHPLRRNAWFRPLARHVPLMLFCALVHTLITAFGAWLGLPGPVAFARVFVELLPGRVPAAVAIYAAVWALGEAVSYAARVRHHEIQRVKLESQMAEARLQALRAQLHPHFLFNTLNTVAMAVRETGNDVALQGVLDLSELLRTMLRHDSTNEVSLRSEIEFTQRYLGIEKLRFRDKLNIRMDVPESIQDAAVPSLLLQPLVENAIRHGLGGATGNFTVSIEAQSRGSALIIVVRDNGPGFARSTGGHGVGLQNSRDRLAALYGNAAQLLLSSADTGAIVQVMLPLRLA